MKSIDKLAFTSELVLERSSGTTPIGMYETEMELYELGLCLYQIEWRCNPLVGEIHQTRHGYQEEHIGIWTRLVHVRDSQYTQELTDYDGIMGWLPTQAIQLLERNGIAVPQDFREED